MSQASKPVTLLLLLLAAFVFTVSVALYGVFSASSLSAQASPESDKVASSEVEGLAGYVEVNVQALLDAWVSENDAVVMLSSERRTKSGLKGGERFLVKDPVQLPDPEAAPIAHAKAAAKLLGHTSETLLHDVLEERSYVLVELPTGIFCFCHRDHILDYQPQVEDADSFVASGRRHGYVNVAVDFTFLGSEMVEERYSRFIPVDVTLKTSGDKQVVLRGYASDVRMVVEVLQEADHMPYIEDFWVRPSYASQAKRAIEDLLHLDVYLSENKERLIVAAETGIGDDLRRVIKRIINLVD